MSIHMNIKLCSIFLIGRSLADSDLNPFLI